jgi:hypothetical protein
VNLLDIFSLALASSVELAGDVPISRPPQLSSDFVHLSSFCVYKVGERNLRSLMDKVS